MRTSKSIASAAALLVLGLGGGCQEPPSYRLRWDIDGAVLARPVQCSANGIFDVQVRTVDELGRTVDVRSFPCFGEKFRDPDAVVPGASLPPGDYAIEVRGVTRNAVVWQDDEELARQIFDTQATGANYEGGQEFELCRPPLPEGAPGRAKISEGYACRPEYLACDCAPVTVVEDTIPKVKDFDLASPPQCLDGLDNDGDGLVDGQDPACAGDVLDAIEGADVANASLSVRMSFFDGNPNAVCSAVTQSTGLSRVLIELDGETLDDSNCTDQAKLFTQPLAAGEHVVSVTLLSAAGEPVATSFETTIEVVERVGGSFDIDAAFSTGDFFEPIESLALFTVRFGDENDQLDRGCFPKEVGFLEISTVRLEFLDGHGAQISTVSRDDATPLDGLTDIACITGRADPETGAIDTEIGNVITESLPWGSYLVTLEGLSAEGEVCFSNVAAATPAAPSESFQVRAPRVFPVPDSCRDCEVDDDCGALLCDDGVCVHCDAEFECADSEMCSDGECTPRLQ